MFAASMTFKLSSICSVVFTLSAQIPSHLRQGLPSLNNFLSEAGVYTYLYFTAEDENDNRRSTRAFR